MAIEYPFIIRRLSDEDGGGYIIEYPDLPGCKSDGDTKEEAIKNGEDAVQSWLEAAREDGVPIPTPFEREAILLYSGRWVQRVSKTLHAILSDAAKQEGISLNTLVIELLTQGITQRNTPRTSQPILKPTEPGRKRAIQVSLGKSSSRVVKRKSEKPSSQN